MIRRSRSRCVRSYSDLLFSLESRILLSAVYKPSAMLKAYGFDQLLDSSGNRYNGAGQTIAIVDAYNDTHIAADLNFFDNQFSVPGGDASNFLTIKSFGARSDSGWGMETSLDVEWAHAIAPGANILLVQAASSSLTDLLTAVDYARNANGVTAVSMSWGTNEFSGETAYDSHFTTPSGGHPNITFLASSGDNGKGTSWPSVSPNVVSVGGTTLNVNSDNSYASESAWSGSGGGISSYESKPSYQSSVTQSSSKRTNPDVAYNADPNTGVYVYDSNYNGQSGWWSVGGTSAGAPQWAALVAIANQIRGGASLTTSQVLGTAYTATGDFHDIVSGSNGYSAVGGYDLATGIGSPKANSVLLDLASTSVPTSSGDYSGSSGGGGNTGPGNSGKGKSHTFLVVTDVSQQTITVVPAVANLTVDPAPAPFTPAKSSTLIHVAFQGATALPVTTHFAAIAALADADLAPTDTLLPTVQPEQSVPAIPSSIPQAAPAPITPDQGAVAPASAAPADQAAQLQETLAATPAAAAPAAVSAVTARSSRWAMLALALPVLAWFFAPKADRREEQSL